MEDEAGEWLTADETLLLASDYCGRRRLPAGEAQRLILLHAELGHLPSCGTFAVCELWRPAQWQALEWHGSAWQRLRLALAAGNRNELDWPNSNFVWADQRTGTEWKCAITAARFGAREARHLYGGSLAAPAVGADAVTVEAGNLAVRLSSPAARSQLVQAVEAVAKQFGRLSDSELKKMDRDDWWRAVMKHNPRMATGDAYDSETVWDEIKRRRRALARSRGITLPRGRPPKNR